MKTLSIAATVALSIVSVSALAKDSKQPAVVDNAFAYTASAAGVQSVVIGTAIEGGFSSQSAVALGDTRVITAGGGRPVLGSGGSEISGTGKLASGVREISGTGKLASGAREISGTGGYGADKLASGAREISGTGGYKAN